MSAAWGPLHPEPNEPVPALAAGHTQTADRGPLVLILGSLAILPILWILWIVWPLILALAGALLGLLLVLLFLMLPILAAVGMVLLVAYALRGARPQSMGADLTATASPPGRPVHPLRPALQTTAWTQLPRGGSWSNGPPAPSKPRSTQPILPNQGGKQ